MLYSRKCMGKRYSLKGILEIQIFHCKTCRVPSKRERQLLAYAVQNARRSLRTAKQHGVNITPYENRLFEAEQALAAFDQDNI